MGHFDSPITKKQFETLDIHPPSPPGEIKNYMSKLGLEVFFKKNDDSFYTIVQNHVNVFFFPLPIFTYNNVDLCDFTQVHIPCYTHTWM